MAMPIRLPVRLQRRRSAWAGAAARRIGTAARSRKDKRMAKQRRCGVMALPLLAAGWRPALSGRTGVDDDRSHVIDIGEGRPGDDEVAKGTEKPGGIVVRETCGRIKAVRRGARERVREDHGAGRIVRAAAAAVAVARDGR